MHDAHESTWLDKWWDKTILKGKEKGDAENTDDAGDSVLEG